MLITAEFKSRRCDALRTILTYVSPVTQVMVDMFYTTHHHTAINYSSARVSQRLRPPPLFASPLACYAQCAAVKCASRGAVTYEPRLQRIARCCTSLSPRQNDLKAARFVRGEKNKKQRLTKLLWDLVPR